MPRKKNDKIDSAAEEILYTMYLSGMKPLEMVDHFAKQGKTFTSNQISKHICIKKWAEKKQKIQEEVFANCEEYVRSNKMRKLQAIHISIDAVLERAIADYMEYKLDPEKFILEVRTRTRHRPLWLTNDVADLDKLIRLEQFIVDDGKLKGEGFGDTNLMIGMMTDKEKKNFLKFVADAKIKAKKDEIEGVVEAEIVVEESVPALPGKLDDD